MYGLKQAALLANRYLIKNLEPHGYYPIPGTNGMWIHKTKNIFFCFCVDDFGIKYFDKKDTDHLFNALSQNYKFSINWTGNAYCGLSLGWNYTEDWVDISMPNYIKKALQKFQYTSKKYPQYSPHAYTSYTPTQKSSYQHAIIEDKSPFFDQKDTKDIQSITGTF